jgi:hypothetical protein
MTSRTNVTAKQSPEAVASMAGIGRSIDQAIGRLSPPALGLPTIQIVSPSNDTNQGRGSGSSPPQIDKSLIDLPAPSAESAPPTPPAETAPPQRSAPPLPKLKPLRKEAEAIDEAIQQATKARELAGVDGDIREGVRAIEEVGRSFDRMKNPLTDGVRESQVPDFWSREGMAGTIGAVAGVVAELFRKGSGKIVGPGTTAGVLGFLSAYDELNPDPFTMSKISERNLRGWEELAELALNSEKDLAQGERDLLFLQFQAAWDEWNSFLGKLVRNIESPDDSPEASALRSDSLEILPRIISDAEKGLEFYKRLLPDDVRNLNQQPLEKAIRLRNRVDYSGTRSQDRDSAFNPPPRVHQPTVSPGVSPASFTDATTPARDSALHPVSYTLPMSLGVPPAGTDQPTQPEAAARATLEELVERVLHRLSEPLRLDPVRLEVRLLDDRVIARRLDGNRSVDVDLSRGYRMVGYISV